jgi:hypothetical protein
MRHDPTPDGLRERAKADRRQRILDAVRRYLRGGVAELSTARTGESVATLYNLIGNRSSTAWSTARGMERMLCRYPSTARRRIRAYVKQPGATSPRASRCAPRRSRFSSVRWRSARATR